MDSNRRPPDTDAYRTIWACLCAFYGDLSHQDREEILQQVMEWWVSRGWIECREPDRWHGFVRTATRHRVLSWLRGGSRGREILQEPRDMEAISAAWAAANDDEASDGLGDAQVHALAFERLSEKERALLTVVAYAVENGLTAGDTYVEARRRLGPSCPSSARGWASAVTRAKQRLLDRLADEDPYWARVRDAHRSELENKRRRRDERRRETDHGEPEEVLPGDRPASGRSGSSPTGGAGPRRARRRRGG